MKEKKIICIAGPTGAGKSSIAAKLGKRLGSEVLNADSRQVYSDFPLITAQPGAEELSLCPHRLYGFLPTEQKISAGQYSNMAQEQISILHDQEKTPVLVGGTGLYFRTLLKGIADIPTVSAEIRQKWQERAAVEGSPALHRQLALVDADYAAKIHHNDRQRITRALEVFEATGHSFSWWHKQGELKSKFSYIYIGIGLPLGDLEPLLYRRIDIMLAEGAIEEARNARLKCADPKAPGWSGIGCAELYRFISGEISLDETKELWKKNTRAYAKRQLTWFRAEPAIKWFKLTEYTEIEEMVCSELGI